MFTHKEKVINKENLQANIQDEHLSSKDKAFSCKDKGLDAHAGPKFSRTKQPSKVT